MDPFGVLGFVIDGVERVKTILQQVRNNDALLMAQTDDVAAHLENLEEILSHLQAKGSRSIMPNGLQRDLEHMRSSLIQSADALLLLSPPAHPSCGMYKRLSRKYQQGRNRCKISALLDGVSSDTDILLRRFTTKWSALARLEVADGTRAVFAQNADTQDGIFHLQATIQQLTAEVRDIRPVDVPEEPDHSTAYLKYRLTKIEVAFRAFEMRQFSTETYTPRPVRKSRHLARQQYLDIVIEALAACSEVFNSPTSVLEEVFERVDAALKAFRRACLADASLKLSQEAIRLARLIDSVSPSTMSRAWLARLLYSYSSVANAADQADAAMASAREAADIYRDLWTAEADTFALPFSEALNKLSHRNFEAGLDQNALALILESVAIKRQLYRADPDATRYIYARALNNLACRQADTGGDEAAAATVREAIELNRMLLENEPDLHRKNLADALHTFGQCMLRLGEADAALPVAEEATDLRKELSAAHPDAHQSDHAWSLVQLGEAHFALGHLPAALAAMEEAILLQRERFRRTPSKARIALAESLNQLAVVQQDVGMAAASLKTATEAVDLLRGKTEPAIELSACLETLAVAKAGLGGYEEAIGCLDEAIQISRTDPEVCSTTKQTDLAAALYSRHLCLQQLDRRYEADREREEAFLLCGANSRVRSEVLREMKRHATRCRKVASQVEAKQIEADMERLQALACSGGMAIDAKAA